jgi:hypothetical protein
MPHKRSSIRIQRREAARIVSQAAIRDPSIQESTNTLTPGRIALILQNRFGRFELDVINRYDLAEVLSDSIGRGTLQRVEAVE